MTRQMTAAIVEAAPLARCDTNGRRSGRTPRHRLPARPKRLPPQQQQRVGEQDETDAQLVPYGATRTVPERAPAATPSRCLFC